MGTTVCRVEGTDNVRPEKSSRFPSADQPRAPRELDTVIAITCHRHEEDQSGTNDELEDRTRTALLQLLKRMRPPVRTPG